jgi:hypothetical protein
MFLSTAFLMSLIWLVWRHKPMLSDLWRFRHQEVSIDWKREVWPLQWKVAVTSICGFFVVALFNPVLFAFQGPAAAGQMGMSNVVVGAVAIASGAWIGTKAAPFGHLIAQRDWDKLDRLFFSGAMAIDGLIVVGGCAVWAGTAWLQWQNHPLGTAFFAAASDGVIRRHDDYQPHR